MSAGCLLAFSLPPMIWLSSLCVALLALLLPWSTSSQPNRQVDIEQVELLRQAYTLLGQRVTTALTRQIGDHAWLEAQHHAANHYLSEAANVCMFPPYYYFFSISISSINMISSLGNMRPSKPVFSICWVPSRSVCLDLKTPSMLHT